MQDGVYRHPSRTAVFVDDFVDRGPHQREVPRIAHAMMDAGVARAVMWNHEFNAIGFAAPDGGGGFLRPCMEKNRAQHRAFLDQHRDGSADHADAVAWFRTLPLWLDLGGLRVVHARWNATAQRALTGWLDEEKRLTDPGVFENLKRGSAVFAAAEVLLKGPEVRLPHGSFFYDKDGHLRHDARLRWWDPAATTFRSAALGMDGWELDLPEDPVPADFAYNEPVPILFGHYWMRGEPHILHPRASCLDFSVAKDGFLTMYRWSGERELRAANLFWVAA